MIKRNFPLCQALSLYCKSQSWLANEGARETQVKAMSACGLRTSQTWGEGCEHPMARAGDPIIRVMILGKTS